MPKGWLEPFPLIPGLGLLLFSATCFVSQSERLVLECNRGHDRCTITVEKHLGPVRQPTLTGALPFSASSLLAAEHTPSRSRDDTGDLVLKTAHGPYRFPPYPLPPMAASLLRAEEINEFIRDERQQELRVVHDTRPAYALL